MKVSFLVLKVSSFIIIIFFFELALLGADERLLCGAAMTLP